jgi:hypothetical protein
MDAPSSDLSRLLDLDKTQKRIVLDRIKSTGSAIGAEVTLNGTKYIITDGEDAIRNAYKRIENLRKKYLK